MLYRSITIAFIIKNYTCDFHRVQLLQFRNLILIKLNRLFLFLTWRDFRFLLRWCNGSHTLSVLVSLAVLPCDVHVGTSLSWKFVPSRFTSHLYPSKAIIDGTNKVRQGDGQFLRNLLSHIYLQKY